MALPGKMRPPRKSPSPAAKPPSRLWPLLLALFAVIVWGMSFSVTRVAVREIPPVSLACIRFVLASLMLAPLVWRYHRRARLAREDRLTVLGLGLTGVSLYFGFENVALKYTTASHGVLIVTTIPLVTELVEAVRLRRRPAALTLAGLFVALFGVLLIFGRDGGGGATLLGDLLMLGAVASWVGYTYFAKHLMQRYPNLLLTQWTMVVGALTLLPAAAAEAYFHPFGFPSPSAWSGIAFLGLFCSSLAYFCWNKAIPALGVTLSSNLLYGLPLVGVATAVFALGEPLTVYVLYGGALILGGVILASWPRGVSGGERHRSPLAKG